MSRRQKDLFPELPDGKKYVSDIPELVAEWHPTKNGELLPEDTSYGSGRKLWWRCAEGHEWVASANTRTNLKAGCPECSIIRVAESLSQASADYNLFVVNPELCEEWHPKNQKLPSEYLPKSGKKVWWQCAEDNEHQWEAVIASRTTIDGKMLHGCPFCANQRVTEENNLLAVNPDLAAEWNYEKNQAGPASYTKSSHEKVWWKCEKGHEWKTAINNRSRGTGCPKCTRQTSKPEIRILTELQLLYRDALSRHKVNNIEIDVYIPSLNVGIEYDGAFWHRGKMKQDRSKQNRIEKMGISLFRVREQPLEKITENDIIVNPKIELTKDVIDQLIRMMSINTKEAQEYLNQSEFQNQELYNIYLDYFPSPFPDNSLLASNPKLVKEWHATKNAPLTPLNFTPNSRHKVWWQCEKGHEWQATIDGRNRKSGGSGCPYCSPTFKLASAGYNLTVSHPHLVEFFHPTKNAELKPEQITGGAVKVIWWRCPDDHSHEFERSPAHMSSSNAQNLCPYCTGTFVSDANSMATTHPKMAEIFHPELNAPLTPHDLRARSHEKFWWRCERGHEWEQTAFNIERTKSKNPCPLCKTLAGRRPDIAGLLHPTKNGKLTGYDLGYWSAKKVWWQCHSNPDHEWQTSASVMVEPSRKALCQYCPPERIQHSISETHPLMEQAFHREKNGHLTPLNTSAGTGKKLWWICSNDPSHEWEAIGANMSKVQRPDLCPTCRRAK